MDHIHARHVVLGAGAMGSATAYHLARRGEPVLLVEQFRVGHDRGSSHGAARITRHSYAHPHCARLMPEAFRAWKTLEADAGQNLYIRTGGVSFGPPEAGYVARVAENLKDIGIPHRRMTAMQVHEALPAFELPENYEAVFEPDAGMLAASRALALEVAAGPPARRIKAEVREECPIRRIDLEGDKPTLISDKHTDHGRPPGRDRGRLGSALVTATYHSASAYPPAGALLSTQRPVPLRDRPISGLHLQRNRAAGRLLRHAAVPGL